MSNPSDFPFSIPLTFYDNGGNPQSVRAQFLSAFPSGSFSTLVVITQNIGPSVAGLYIYYPDRWRLVIPYSYIDDYVIGGGSIKIWSNLASATTPDTGAQVFRNGLLDNVSSMTPSTGVLWATILTNPESGTSYILPPASTTNLGGVIVPASGALTVDGSGKIGVNVGAGLSVASNALTAAVVSVNGKTGALTLTATDVGAAPTADPTFTGTVTAAAISASGNITSTNQIVSTLSNAGSGASSNFVAQSTGASNTPSIGWGSLSGGTNSKWWSAYTSADGTGMFFNLVNDANNSATNWLTVTRAGMVVSAIASNSGSGSWTHTGSMATTGNVTVQGTLSSTSNLQPAGTTNSGVAVGGGPNYALAAFYDQTLSPDNRTAEAIFINGGMTLRFKNDAGSQATPWLTGLGGYASGITGITSNSGSGSWAHTGPLSVQSVASGGNNLVMTGTNSTGVPTLSTAGAAVNISMNIATKGAGGINLQSSTAITGTLSTTGDTTIAGNVISSNAGTGIRVAEGTNAKQGTAVLAAGTVTVANTSVTANSRIFLSIQSLGTVTSPQAIGVTARVAGTSFTITSASNTDTSVIAYEIFEPA